MRPQKGKASIVVLIVLITLGVMILICKSPEFLQSRAENKLLSSLPTEIQNPLKKWTKGITISEGRKKDLLDNFGKPEYPHQYGLLGQGLYITGDFRGGILNLKQGLSIQPSAAELHHELGKIYYFIALFDMVDRGCAVIENKTPKSVPLTASNYLRYEINFLLHNHTTLRSHLFRLGYKDEKSILRVNFFLLQAQREKLIDAAKESVALARRELGNPSYLPVPSFMPDQKAQSILRHALAEIEKGNRGISITRNLQMGLVDPIGIKNIEERIRTLMDQVK
ncbi:MAG: hypothetical protein WBC45_04580 [Atribacterota bacterium]